MIRISSIASISALFPNDDVLAGDLAVGGITFLGGIAFKGHVRKPPFEDDSIIVRRSLLQLLDRGARAVQRYETASILSNLPMPVRPAR